MEWAYLQIASLIAMISLAVYIGATDPQLNEAHHKEH